jgi:hypothetical protein
MSLKITNYLVVDSNIDMRELKISKNCYEYTSEGSIFYPIKSVIPVIVKGKGCVGTAVIKQILIKEETTTVGFEFNTVDSVTAKVMYSMYMNNASMMNTSDGDIYNHDVSIPGAINAPVVNLADKLGQREGQKIMRDVYDTISGRRSSPRNSFNDDDDDY